MPIQKATAWGRLAIKSSLKEQFQVECDKKLKFFRTTIFDEDSIIKAFGRIFELSIPKAARSKLVGEKSIESGEEYSDKFAVEQFKPEEEKSCPFCNIQLFKTDTGYECNICGYKPRAKIKKIEAEPIKPKITIDDLKAQFNAVKADSNTPTTSATEAINEPVPTINDIKKSISSSMLEADFENNIPKILDLSFNKEETERKLTLDQKRFLNYCYNIKIPLEVIRFILNEFIVKYDPKKLMINNQNIIHAIQHFKFGYVKDEDFVKFLFLNEYSKNLNIQDILWNNFPFPFKEKIFVEKEENLENKELDKEALMLSFKEKIGAKFDFKEFNLDINFYKGKHKLGQITVPYDITPKDLKYMLVFELNFPIENNLQGFVEESTDKLLNEITKQKQIPKEVQSMEVPVVDTPQGQETDLLVFSESKNLYYKVMLHEKEFEIKFVKDSRDFGKIEGQNTISASGMFQLVKNNTLLPSLIEDDELMFNVLDMFNKFSQFKK